MPSITAKVNPAIFPEWHSFVPKDGERTDRIAKYLARELHPQKALNPRICFVDMEDDAVVGFIAGHLTRRYQCDGELEWVNVASGYRGTSVASELLRMLAQWFAG